MAIPSMLERFYTNRGPRNRVLQVDDEVGRMPVIDRPGQAGDVVGLAHPSGWIDREDGRAVLWRLEVSGKSLDGLWVCHGRRFDPV